MEIDHGKCITWINKIMELIQLTKELNNKEAKYIKATVSIALGNLELQELKADNKYKLEKEEIKNV